MALTDTHCHLDSDQFDHDRAEVLLRAQQAGISRILIPGVNLRSSAAAIQLAAKHEMLFAAIGIHPTEATGFDDSTLDELRRMAERPKVRAIGEIGLDYYWDRAPHDLQRRVLLKQLGLAAELHLPVVLHFREKGDAPDGECATDLLVILEEWKNMLQRETSALAENPGVLHSFSGSVGTARQALRLGFYLGVTGPVTHRKERQELVASLPREHLLIETDAPYLAPAPHRGKRNEPAFVRHIADKIALLQSCSIEEVEAATTANAAGLFAWE